MALFFNVSELYTDLLAVVGDRDDYCKVTPKLTTATVHCDPFVSCSFIDPDTEELSFPMAWTSLSWSAEAQIAHGDPFGRFIDWMADVLPSKLKPCRGDGCLYQAGWVAIICDGKQMVTVNFQYSELLEER